MFKAEAREIYKRELIQDGVDELTAEKFLDYHERNPGIWKAFERYALQAARSGKRIGAKAVAERVRWEEVVENKGSEDFKFGNSFVAYYARIFMIKYRSHSGYGDFFETRTTKGIAA